MSTGTCSRRRRRPRLDLEAMVAALSLTVAEQAHRIRFLEVRRLPAPLLVLGPTRGAQEHAED